MSDEFVGRGWAFPLRTDATGGIALVSREREIEEAIRLILGTSPGERPMRPEFGCRIHDYVFGLADGTTANEVTVEVRRALARWEPRIDVDDVIVSFDANVTAYPPGATHQISLTGWARHHLEAQLDGTLAEKLVRELAGIRLCLRPELVPEAPGTVLRLQAARR